MSKKILLLVPDDYQLYRLIEKNLEFLGLEVVTIVHNSVKFRYQHIGQRLYNVFRKIKDGNNSYKQELKLKYTADTFIETINAYPDFDYCLVLRSDFFHPRVLEAAKQKSKKMVSYHYDGLKRNPVVIDRIPIFDKFYVFDQEDVLQEGETKTFLSHNFYFDFDQSMRPILYDMFFLGFYNESREASLLNFHAIVKRLLKTVKFQIVFPPESRGRKSVYADQGIECLHHVIPFKEYLNQVESTRIIVDFLISAHKGLSFRIFEGLKYKRKVITTNPNVKNYDFYTSSNFYILDESNLDEEAITNFIQTPYVEIDEKIRLKYSFSEWFRSIMVE